MLVAGKYSLDFLETRQSDDKKSFLWWVTNHLNSVRIHSAAQLEVFKALHRSLKPEDSIESVVEFFAGSGIGSAIIQGLFKPTVHRAYDLDPQCTDHLRAQKNLADRIEVVEADAEVTMLNTPAADLQVCDFFKFTPLRMLDWKPQLDAVFARNPKAVQITDTSLAYLHIWKSRYAELLGYPFTNPAEYLTAYSHRFFDDYGYRVLAAAYGSQFACMMLVPATEYQPPELLRLNKDDGLHAVQLW